MPQEEVMTQPTQMIRPEFFLARRDTRWDPYPSQEPLKAVALDWHGFWEQDSAGRWFKTPVSYVRVKKITEAEANADWAERFGALDPDGVYHHEECRHRNDCPETCVVGDRSLRAAGRVS
jgi:hypothetical protein